MKLHDDTENLWRQIRKRNKAIKILADALNQIAAWRDGDEVGNHFDDPASAKAARIALSKASKHLTESLISAHTHGEKR